MKIKDLEKYISNNRKRLDVESADDKMIWQEIQPHLSGKDNLKRKYLFWKAAALILAFVTAGIVVLYEIKQNPEQNGHDIAEKSFLSQQHMYNKAINARWQEIDSQQLDIEDFPWLMNELEEIEKVHLEYLKDMKKMGERPEIKHALQKYYVQKIRLLDRLLNEIEKKQNYENRKENDNIIY
mgnify:CR=1 FL=1